MVDEWVLFLKLLTEDEVMRRNRRTPTAPLVAIASSLYTPPIESMLQ